MQGTIAKCDVSKSGKSFRVKIGDSWFGASKDSGADKLVGKSVTAEVEETDFGPWLENIKAQNGSAPTAPSNGNGDRWWMSFVSNTVAHAIQAGHISQPDQIKVWAAAAKQAASEL